MKKQKWLIIGSGIVFSLIGLILCNLYLKNSVPHQIKMLKHGNTEQKIHAMSFLADKKEYSIIPELVVNVGREDRAFWIKDRKGGLVSLSCVATWELSELTEISFGDACDNGGASDFEQKNVIISWREWYKNEYPDWIDRQQVMMTK